MNSRCGERRADLSPSLPEVWQRNCFFLNLSKGVVGNWAEEGGAGNAILLFFPDTISRQDFEPRICNTARQSTVAFLECGGKRSATPARCRTHGRDARATTCRFMESPLSFCACIGTMNLTTRWERGSVSRSTQGFSRRMDFPESDRVGEAAAGRRPALRDRRFMESPDAFLARIGTMNRFVLVLVLVLVLESKPPNRGRGRERRRGRKGGSWRAPFRFAHALGP